MPELSVRQTKIPGLLIFELPLMSDARGWFKENWHRQKMEALGLPDFGPVQNNMSLSHSAGVTRGFHAEPWDKLVSVAHGRVFSAWVDLREGDTFGQTLTLEMGPETAIFLPRGVANSYQTLTEGSVYSYLVNEHWTASARERYTYLNLADETVAVDWPVPLEQTVRSEADLHHPRLADVTPMPRGRVLVTGANGQLGRALRSQLPHAQFTTRDELDIADPAAVAAFDFDGVETIINAAAFTGVDAAETPAGRGRCWATNATGARLLTEAARRHRATLVHVSSDYVFDGSVAEHTEDEPVSPLGSYGASKAAADAAIAMWPRHYIVRTSWVVGDGANFVRTMAGLARRGVSPSVVNDQFGRLTFADDLARGVLHLISSQAPFGTYNLTSDGPTRSWYDIASSVFAHLGVDATITPVDTATYVVGKAMAPRPRNSTLRLDKIRATGFVPGEGDQELASYIETLH